MTDLFVDADILIHHLRGREVARAFLQPLFQDETMSLWIGAMQRAEVLFHIRTGEEAAVLGLLKYFSTAPVTEAVVDLAADIFRRWNPGHGTGRNDAILAATVMLARGKLITQNIRHFSVPGLDVERGWDE